MATRTDKDFKLVTSNDVTEFSPGGDVTLHCDLSPETSAVAMEIRWFRETDCIYQYKNGHVTEGTGYEGRVSVDPQGLQRGDVSLTLKSRQEDKGRYTCQVISGERKIDAEINLAQRVPLGVPLGGMLVRKNTLTAEERKKMEVSVRHLDLNPHLVKRRNSLDVPPVLEEAELRLVLLGGSAALKKAAGNTILGTHTLTHTSTETQHSESRQGKVAGRRVTLVETPDWFCSGLSEKDVRMDVGLCVSLSAPGPHVFLLVIPVEPSEGEERRMLEKMEDIFGEGCWRHTLILFTHSEGQRERSVEELLETGSQELQQLVEKCGNRCHLLNVKDRHDDTQITQLLEKIEEMVSGNRERFYSSELYQEAEKQRERIETRIEKEWRERKERKQIEIKIRHEKELKNCINKMKREVQLKEDKICALERRIEELEKELAKEENEVERRELERQLNEEKHKRKEIEMEIERLKEEFEKEKRDIEERHREEMEEMRENYEREAMAEAERNLMKIILPELQRKISIFKVKMEAEFRETEEKNRQLEEKNRQLEEKNREIMEENQVLIRENAELKKKCIIS